ncbi:uncharacterized protein A4U43_C05F3240 [Asparagus officinalis]|uniref:WRKY domain-containing protein n=1 Tax=Asparagus officinalis TaxID=4686 RepID=A0A5P1ESP8_ASPOF|nr:probable WRKY transcription factor 49 [Asparagus officinalis]ONK67739.1 uncharacterized protein A4U43_C05F3240 [Asparagus officinalis]
MEETDEAESYWLHELEDELSKDLDVSETVAPQESTIRNKLIANIYSGPTINDIENALASSYQSRSGVEGINKMHPVMSASEKGYGKIENKYTIRIKSSGNGLADDGYKWRKYGQKTIKNSPNPRSYYRCTNSRCHAKKQVERSTEDPETLIVTYEGLHLHYTYSHFLLPRPQNSLHMPKKPKIQNPSSEDKHNEELKAQSPETRTEQEEQKQSRVIGEDKPQEDFRKDLETTYLSIIEEQNSKGLLEDIVPFFVRNPSSSTTSSIEPSSPSQVSSPSYSSSLSWSPIDFYFDEDILSYII